MVVIDTDVILLAFAYHDDPRQSVNARFLRQVQISQPAITIYTLMETLGQLSFNLAPEKLDAWRFWLVDAYQLMVIWPAGSDTLMSNISFRQEILERPLMRMRKYRAAFMDALIMDLAERLPDSQAFVTWNARHFKGKMTMPVLTPQAYLEQ